MKKAKTPPSFKELYSTARDILGPEEDFAINYWLPSGLTLLDMIVSDGAGFPGGRVTEIFGPEAAGKSMLALLLGRAAQQQGGMCIYLDAEARLSHGLTTKKIGLSISHESEQWIYGIPDNLEKALEAIEKLSIMRKEFIQPTVIVLDSIAMLSSQDQDIDHATIEEAKQPGVQAKLLSKFFARGILRKISGTNVHLVLLNQLRDKMGGGGNKFVKPDPEPPGGWATRFAASTRLHIHQTAITNEERKVGSLVHIKVRKTSTNNPYQEIFFPLYHKIGVCDVMSNLNYLIANKVFTLCGGGYYEYKGEKKRRMDWWRLGREDTEWNKHLVELTKQTFRDSLTG